MRKCEKTLSQTYLKSIIKYDLNTGIFYWLRSKNSHGGKIQIGDVAGNSLKSRKHIVIGIDGFRFYAHRLAWFYVVGEWPKEQIDHIDMDGSNNKWENLRLATMTQQRANQHARCDNLIGVKGVRKTRNGNFSARIRVNGKSRHLGTFLSIDLAKEAYMIAANTEFGHYARHE